MSVLVLQRSGMLGAVAGWMLFASAAFAFSPKPQPPADYNRLFEGLAKAAPRGLYPRYFQGEQSYFTVVGADDGGAEEGLLNTDGALEVDKGAFMIEPFVRANGRLITWNDVQSVAELEQDWQPIPSVVWSRDGLSLKVTAFSNHNPNGSTLYGRYRLENTGSTPMTLTLFLALRPFQVNPPWQSLNMEGGVAPIHSIRQEGRGVCLNGGTLVYPLSAPAQFGAVRFDQAPITDFLARRKLPTTTDIDDARGFASGAFRFEIKLAPGATREYFLAMPGHDAAQFLHEIEGKEADATDFGRARFREVVSEWSNRIARTEFVVPTPAKKIIDSLHTNLGYIFINRDGSALQPGSRTYARAWIRDGAIISSALLGLGYTSEVRQFMSWYAGYQFPDGKIPCCVDQRGADAVPENDSHGEFIYTVAEYYRYTRDTGFVREMWPHIVKAVDYIQSLRAQRMTAAYRDGDKDAYYGLVPESISHEGYASHPVHAFWDDFWTLRGLKDAAYLASQGMDGGRTASYAELRDDFAHDLYAAMQKTMERGKIGFLPASVELADFDPNAVALFIGTLGEQTRMPQAALRKTFDDWYDYFAKRRDGKTDWDAYTPYEVRLIEAFVRLGQRERALEVLRYQLENQSPPAWNQWAEVVWRDPSTPKFIGDMPHGWIGAEYIRSVRSLFAFEREADDALVLAAGIPADWVESDTGVAVKRLPTWYGTFDYTLKADGADAWRLSLSGDIRLPPGKIVVQPPRDRPVKSVVINGHPVTSTSAAEVVVGEFPAEVEIMFGDKLGNAEIEAGKLKPATELVARLLAKSAGK